MPSFDCQRRAPTPPGFPKVPPTGVLGARPHVKAKSLALTLPRGLTPSEVARRVSAFLPETEDAEDLASAKLLIGRVYRSAGRHERG